MIATETPLAERIGPLHGASSKSIAAHLAGLGPQRGDYPHDAGDFSRCEALLTNIPELREAFPRMAEVNAYWRALVPRWAEIAAATDKTTLLKSILAPIEKADPDHIRWGTNASIRTGNVTFQGDMGEQGDDHVFTRAVLHVWKTGSASSSALQRTLGIGYNFAARLIERMEEMGIVSKANHVGKREVRDPDALRAALNIRKEITDIAGEEAGAILLKAIVADLAKTNTARRRAKGIPPMKHDPDFAKQNTDAYSVTAEEMRSFIERTEQLEAEKKDIADQIKEVMAEAKGRGYDTKILRRVLALRKRKPDEVAEEEAVLDVYKAALGMA